MTYSYTKEVNDGVCIHHIAYFDCDLCGKKICESDPHFIIKDRHFCYDCFHKLIKEWLDFNIGGIAPYYLASLLEKYKRRRQTLSKKLRTEIFRKHKATCPICGEKNPTKLSIDHIIPYSKGGTDDPKNLRILCKSCNSKKGVKLNA